MFKFKQTNNQKAEEKLIKIKMKILNVKLYSVN